MAAAFQNTAFYVLLGLSVFHGLRFTNYRGMLRSSDEMTAPCGLVARSATVDAGRHKTYAVRYYLLEVASQLLEM